MILLTMHDNISQYIVALPELIQDNNSSSYGLVYIYGTQA